MENLETGLLLMVVGMTTVFAILLIVINLGKGLITLVNKYAPEEVTVKKQIKPQPQVATTAPVTGITNQTTAAIISAVSVVTGGKGKVVKIEKS
ncbi:OadG family protein [Parabacteroides sp. AM08-6]|uniref:OadG family protein n=1 Tax=Parabacteroides sp. AM08-6 TaxID=2292053 RepID=UPI000EFF254F|nr:OadG family protein [Parabacteroides sp. AM08-6]RHJ81210.1 oxaloacetate decarboxylase [Parabacteroides sp. AM08-6]